MELKFDLLAIVQQLEDTPEGIEQFLSELLFFPEFRSLGNDGERIQRAQLKLAQAVIGQLPGDGPVRRSVPPEAETDKLVLELDPASRGAAWTVPVRLELPVVTWAHGESAQIAYIPVLGIEVVASSAKKLPEMLESHADFEIRRRGLANSLLGLAYISRAPRLQLRRVKWRAEIEGPAERIRFEEQEKERILPKVGSRIEVGRRPRAYCREREVERLANLLGGGQPSCVLLVGESGVGKTAVTLEMARQRAQLGFSGRFFWRTSGSRIVAGQTGFGMWQERCARLIDEAKETRSILCMGNLYELMQVGQSVSNTESIAAFLRPAMVRADLLVIAECTPGQLAAIEVRDPKILDPFRRITLEEPPPEVALEILSRLNAEADGRLAGLDAPALAKLDALHRRYMTCSAFPGRPARFLRGMRAEYESGRVVSAADVTREFGRETGLPALMLDEDAPFDTQAVRAWFLERVHAQDAAVELVVDRLAIVKAQLARPRQPLASFLFTGPTGVGKTELAKTLAEFLYGSKRRLLRLDMSEYGSPAAASRLISSSFEQSEGILTARVRDQPFSVILLDEFEKAHASLFDLFLQVLGEGRLTDAAGRLADFSNCVIIMTSNLGAQAYQRPELGFAADGEAQRDAYAHFLAVVKEAFRPEFFNRIDRVVPFAPLGREAIRAIARREVGLAAARDGLAGKRIVLAVTEPVLDWLVELGHDPRYGARPLKRALEQRVLIPVADFLNRSPRRGGKLTVELEPGGAGLAISWEADSGGTGGSVDQQRAELARAIDAASQVRRDYLKLRSSPLVAELESEKRRIDRQKESAYRKAWRRRKKKGSPDPVVPFVPELEKRLEIASELLGRLASESGLATEREVQLMVDYYADTATAPQDRFVAADADAAVVGEVGESEFTALLLDIFSATKGHGDRASLVLISKDPGWLFDLAEGYLRVFEIEPGESPLGYFRRSGHDVDLVTEEGLLKAISVGRGEFQRLADGADGDIGALVFEVEGEHAGLRVADEAGLHQRQRPDARVESCLVGVSQTRAEKFQMPLSDIVEVRTKDRLVRRMFDESKGLWKDQVLRELGSDHHRGGGTFGAAQLASILEETLRMKAREAIR